MKKLLFFAAALLMFAVPAANAQNVNTANELKKLDKVDAEVADAKKGAKAATWIKRADAYVKAYIAPTKELGHGVPQETLMFNVPLDPKITPGEFKGVPAHVCNYEYVQVYLVNGMIEGWNQLKSIKEDLPQTAIESLAKAYELDPKQESKIAPIALTLSNALAQQGDALNDVGRTLDAAQSYELAYRAQSIVPSTKTDGNFLFNAGVLTLMYGQSLTGDEALAACKKAENIFNEALSTGYTDVNGNIYYYLFHSYYGQKSADAAKYLPLAKEALLNGIKLFPKNNTILDGLMTFYTAEEGVGDPAELIALVENSLKDDPTNYDLWFGRGRVYNALKDYDECIKSFKKCVELRPEDYDANFYTGYFIIEKANAQIEALNSNTGLSYEAYEEENAKINNVYAEAIPWLEKAHNINPSEASVIDFLNKLCFRLRDMDGMMEKYNKYHELYKQNQ